MFPEKYIVLEGKLYWFILENVSFSIPLGQYGKKFYLFANLTDFVKTFFNFTFKLKYTRYTLHTAVQ